MQLIRIHVAWSRIIGIIEIKLVVLNRRHSSDDAAFRAGFVLYPCLLLSQKHVGFGIEVECIQYTFNKWRNHDVISIMQAVVIRGSWEQSMKYWSNSVAIAPRLTVPPAKQHRELFARLLQFVIATRAL